MEIAGLAGSPFCIVPGGLSLAPGILGRLEVDALSYGRDDGEQVFFSVDEFAVGVPSATPPNVFTEGVAGAEERRGAVCGDAS